MMLIHDTLLLLGCEPTGQSLCKCASSSSQPSAGQCGTRATAKNSELGVTPGQLDLRPLWLWIANVCERSKLLQPIWGTPIPPTT